MATSVSSIVRAGQSSIPEGSEQLHTLVTLVENRPGAIDRVIGLLRRRRANMQTLALGRSEQSDVVRITVVVNDSDVVIEQLVEQLRKLVDVQLVENITFQHGITRELALIKVNSTFDNVHELVEKAQLFGAHIVDMSPETVTLEAVGSEEKLEKLVALLQVYGIREIARSGRVSIARGAEKE